MKQLIYLFVLILATSCGNMEVLEAPWDTEPIPVVYSVITPNEPVEVFLKQTFNSHYPRLKNPYTEAKVFMCGADSNWTELSRLKADTCVFTDAQHKITIETGKTYTLKIEINNKTVRAQTTVPAVNAVINDVVCYYNGSITGSVIINGAYVSADYNYLTVNYTLPTDRNYGYSVSSFEKQPIGLIDLSGTRYVSSEFPCPQDSSSIILKLITLDPYLKKYQLALAIAGSQGQPQVSIIDAISGSFGGVLPQFNNIVNGVGIFGSTVIDSKRIEVIKKTN